MLVRNPAIPPSDVITAELRTKLEGHLADISGHLEDSNVLLYYSSGLEHSELCSHDVDRLQDAIRGMDGSKNLAFILHTPGGHGHAAFNIINALHQKFQGAKITAVVPAGAHSAGTIIALSCHRIILNGRNSVLSPIDPIASFEIPVNVPVKEVVLHPDRATARAARKRMNVLFNRVSEKKYAAARKDLKDLFIKLGRTAKQADETLKIFYDDPGKQHHQAIHYSRFRNAALGLDDLAPMGQFPELNHAAKECIKLLKSFTESSNPPNFRVFLPFPA